MTEQEMRDSKVPTHKTSEALRKYIEDLANQKHDYGTCVYAMSMAATAAFNFIANRLGVTGFQASCADMDILRRTRNLERFMIINLDDALYPQYNLVGKVQKYLDDNKDYLVKKAQENLDKESNYAVDSVIEHWQKLVKNG